MEFSETKDSHRKIEDNRRHKRQDFPYTVVEYVLHPDTTYKIFIGFTSNLSRSGLCLFTNTLLKEGQEIFIKSNIPSLSRKAKVCWVEKYDSSYYKVGLKFIA